MTEANVDKNVLMAAASPLDDENNSQDNISDFITHPNIEGSSSSSSSSSFLEVKVLESFPGDTPGVTDAPSRNSFEYHDKLNLPPAPRGLEWAFQISKQRWILKPLAEAEITALEYADYEDNTTTANKGTSITAPPPVMLEHWTQPTDTFTGLCLKYGITATQLRRANFGFSGTNLSLAPNPLKIPNIRRAVPEETDREKILQSLQLVFRGELTKPEAICYLELNDWDVHQALHNAEQDLLKEATDPWGERALFDTRIEKVVIDEEL